MLTGCDQGYQGRRPVEAQDALLKGYLLKLTNSFMNPLVCIFIILLVCTVFMNPLVCIFIILLVCTVFMNPLVCIFIILLVCTAICWLRQIPTYAAITMAGL